MLERLVQTVKLSRNVIKWIAILTMIIDHIGAAFLTEGSTYYFICRFIGRISLPLFAYLFADGFDRIKNHKKHIIELFMFAIISEPFYDRVIHGQWLCLDNQNIFFTWLVCYLMLLSFNKVDGVKSNFDKLTFKLAIMATAGLVTYFLGFDYTFAAVVSVACAYYFKKMAKIGIPLLMFASYLNPGVFVSMPILLLYDSNKPCKYTKFMKYAFISFYPIHLFVMYILIAFVL